MRTSSVRRRRPVRLLTLAGALALLAVACGGGSTTFSSHGVSFDYPSDWSPIPSLSVPSTGGTGSTRDAVGLNPNDAAILVVSSVRVSVNQQNLASVKAALVGALTQGAQATGGQAGVPTDDSMGGLPGFGLRIDNIQVNGVLVSSNFVVAFQGQTEYLLNCQWTSDKADEMQKGCRQIVDSFKVTGSAGPTSS